MFGGGGGGGGVRSSMAAAGGRTLLGYWLKDVPPRRCHDGGTNVAARPPSLVSTNKYDYLNKTFVVVVVVGPSVVNKLF